MKQVTIRTRNTREWKMKNTKQVEEAGKRTKNWSRKRAIRKSVNGTDDKKKKKDGESGKRRT